MRRQLVGAAVLAGALAMALTASAEPLKTTPLKIEQIETAPALSSVALSLSGRYVAGLVNQEGEKWPVLSIWDLDNLSAPAIRVPSNGRQRPVQLSFLADSAVLVGVDQPLTKGSCKQRAIRQQAVSVDGKKAGAFFDFEARGGCGINDGGLLGVFQAGNFENPQRYLISGNGIVSMNPSEIRFRGPNADAALETVARASDDDAYVMADIRDGQLMVKERLESTSDGWRVVREIKNRSTGAFEEHPALGYVAKDRYTVDLLGFYDPDPNKLYVSTNLPTTSVSETRTGGESAVAVTASTNFTQIRIYDIATKQWDPQPAFASPSADVSGVRPGYDWKNKKVLGPISYIVEGPSREEIFIDDYYAPVQRAFKARFPGQTVRFIGDLSRSNGRAVIEVQGPKNPPIYYVMFDPKTIQLLGPSRPEIDSKTLGETTFVTYAARDGLQIPGFLTLPPGYDKAKHGRIPVVILPHGGPWARDYLSWDSSGWPQFLATRGYGVLQPQYRGSDGWGQALWKAGDREWGQKMSDDNDDGAAWLVSQGIADPSKMAIFGYSYGGFAAIAASVRPNSPYKCAISGAGVSDLERIGNLWGAGRIQREVQGATVKGMDPIRNVEKANIPILLYHGENDRQADTVHSRDFYGEMKGKSKDVEYHEIKNMWHQLPWWPEWHRESLGLIENYLKGPKCFGG